MDFDHFPSYANTFEDIFTVVQPLGPIQTAGDIDIEEFEAVFEGGTRLWKNRIAQPNILIGRKGSGKTAFLKGLTLEQGKGVTVFLRSNDIYSTSLDIIQKIMYERRLVFVEDLADIWKKILWTLIGFEMLKSQDPFFNTFFELIRGYFMQFNINEDDSYRVVFSKILDVIKMRLGTDMQLAALFDATKRSIGFNVPDFCSFDRYLREIAKAFGRETERSALVLIDNLEELDIRIENLPDAASALLKAVSEFRLPKIQANVTMCIPSEIFHHMMVISSNPSKDFEKNVILQWKSADLIKIVASRIAKFLFVYRFDVFRQHIHFFDINQKSSASSICKIILPSAIVNRLGISEAPLTYILRHSQLLPRNVLQIMTEIIKLHLGSGGKSFPVAGDAIIEGVRTAEVILTNEVFRGYKLSYPRLREVCDRALNQLPVVFRYGDLHKNFNRIGKHASGQDEFIEYQRMLVETGVIGRVIDRTDKYVVGLFEYTLPNRLNITDRDELCVHPIFSGIFRCLRREQEPPIYPFGSEPPD